MQGREGGPRAGARTTTRRWLAPTAVLVVALVAAGWWWQSQAAADTPASVSPRLSLQADADARFGEPTPPAAATIVDETVPTAMAMATATAGGDTGELVDPAVNPMLVMARPDTTTAVATATPDGAPNPFLVGAAPAAPVAARPAAPRRGPARTASGGEPDLLAVLLGNIKPGQSSSSSEGSGLDTFIQTMAADDGVASAGRNRNGRPQRTRSQQIQQNLRDCPAANTAKGVKCRQDICAVYAGRDPACPAAG